MWISLFEIKGGIWNGFSVAICNGILHFGIINNKSNIINMEDAEVYMAFIF